MPNNENGQNGARGPYRKPDWRPFFLAELERTNCVKAALSKAQISRRTYDRYKAKHPDFEQVCREARENAVDEVEAVVHQRCLRGDKIKRFDREGKEYYETNYPDTLIIRYLQAQRPEKWHRAPASTTEPIDQNKMMGVIYLPCLEDVQQ